MTGEEYKQKLHDIVNYTLSQELIENDLLHKRIDELNDIYESECLCNYCDARVACFFEGEDKGCTDFRNHIMAEEKAAIKTLIKSGWLADYSRSIMRNVLEDDLK